MFIFVRSLILAHSKRMHRAGFVGDATANGLLIQWFKVTEICFLSILEAENHGVDRVMFCSKSPKKSLPAASRLGWLLPRPPGVSVPFLIAVTRP